MQGHYLLYAGSASQQLAESVATQLGAKVGKLQQRYFEDGEFHCQVEDSVRGQNIFIIQSTSKPVNDHLMELLIMLDDFRRASAASINVIMPYFGYSRQEKKSTGREPITARLVADLLTTAGASRVISVDLHNPAIQGFFTIPMDHLTAVPILAEHLKKFKNDRTVIVSPDAGRVKLADKYAALLEVPLVVLHKHRSEKGVEVRALVGEVAGRCPIIIDDMISTGGTIVQTVQTLLEAKAKPEMIVAATHGVLVGPALERLQHPAIKQVVLTDTITIPPEKQFPHLRQISMAELLARTIHHIHHNLSVSALFGSDRIQPV